MDRAMTVDRCQTCGLTILLPDVGGGVEGSREDRAYWALYDLLATTDLRSAPQSVKDRIKEIIRDRPTPGLAAADGVEGDRPELDVPLRRDEPDRAMVRELGGGGVEPSRENVSYWKSQYEYALGRWQVTDDALGRSEARVVELTAALRYITEVNAALNPERVDWRRTAGIMREKAAAALAAAGEGEATSRRDWVCSAHGTVPESEVAWESHSQIPVHQSPCNRDVEPADAVEGDRPDEGGRILEMFKAHKTEGHDSAHAPVAGCTFCTYRMEELPLVKVSGGGVEPSREAYNDLREAAEDRIIELEDQAKAAEARVVELAEALHKAADALYEAHEYIVDDMGGASGFGRVADRYRALAAAGEGEGDR
jgi:hypothetical protein